MFRVIRRFFNFLSKYILFTVVICTIVWFVMVFKSNVVAPNTYLYLKLHDTIKENEGFSFYPAQPSLSEIRKILKQAKEDPKVKGLILEIYTSCIGYAHAEELHRLIQEFKRNGKAVYAFSDTFGEGENSTASYLLTTAADQIWLQPGGELNVMGLVVSHPFAKDFLEKHKIKVHVEKRNNYKAALDWITNMDYNPYVKENLKKLLSNILDTILENIAKSRNISLHDLRVIIDQAPLLDVDAIKFKLVDRLGYKDELLDEIKTANKDANYLALEKYPLKAKKADNEIGVIYLDGQIARFKPKLINPFSETITDQYVDKLVRKAVKDGCKALVIRVNSPGGSAVASESIYRSLVYAKSKKIPIVISMGNVAASGGYLLATAADKILAEATTITGSIGVITARPETLALWNDYGFNWSHIGIGKNSTLYLTSSDLSEDQKEKIKNSVSYIYERFKEKVKRSRPVIKDIEAVSGGRVFTGGEAFENGLVDDIGGLDKAIEVAAGLAKIKTNYRISEYPRKDFSTFLSKFQDDNYQIIVNILNKFNMVYNTGNTMLLQWRLN